MACVAAGSFISGDGAATAPAAADPTTTAATAAAAAAVAVADAAAVAEATAAATIAAALADAAALSALCCCRGHGPLPGRLGWCQKAVKGHKIGSRSSGGDQLQG
eukprot:3320909-Pleurochrysis_carterae.AAC.1